MELASAAGVAGLKKMAAAGEVPTGVRIVCVLTGHGLKDPDFALESSPAPTRIGTDREPLLQALNLV